MCLVEWEFTEASSLGDWGGEGGGFPSEVLTMILGIMVTMTMIVIMTVVTMTVTMT